MPLPISNLLFVSLPASEQAILQGKLEAVALPSDTVLFEADRVPEYLHLITSGVASVVTGMTGGESVEVGLVGREGIPGTLYLLGDQFGSARCFMQLAGTGLRMPYRAFEEAFHELPGLHRLVLQHVQHESLITRQLSACNRVHDVEERLARWLLMAADRVGGDDLALTQEFLADMIGARRSTVTVAAGILQRAGLIDYRRGHVKILDRERLEEAACECYPQIRNLFQSLYLESAASRERTPHASPSVPDEAPAPAENYTIVVQTAEDLASPDNSPSVSMWPYLLSSAQPGKINSISVYAERGASREQTRVLYMNATALEVWRKMGYAPRVIGSRHRPPMTAQLSFGMPFSE